MPRIFLSFFLLFLSTAGWSQLSLGGGTVRGTITDAASGAPLDIVSVTNTTRSLHVYSSEDGRYSIEAASGDKIAFTHVGYLPVTITAVTADDRDVSLSRKTQYLPETIVRPNWTDYQADSIHRARTYQRTLARQKGGSGMSPVTLLAEALSKRSRQIQRFQKEFYQMEDQRFVDSRYTPALVTTLTGLQADSVAMFMNSNPMPAEYARAVGDLELKLWIRSTYREWMAKMKTLVVPSPAVAVDSVRRISQ